MKRKILVVDDEKTISDIVKFNLEKEGYEVVCAYDGEEGLALVEKEKPELIILDIMMPKLDGFEVCKKIRETLQTPIIMMTARAEEVDKILGFDLGADDYVTKPFGVKELMARIKANLRKRVDETNIENNCVIYGDIKIDLGKFNVYRNNEIIDLTRREFELINFLASQYGQVFSRETLLQKVWGYKYLGDLRTVDVTIRRLRTKIEKNPESPKYILTKRGVGYFFNV